MATRNSVIAPEREADGVDGLVGQCVDHPRRQVGVGLGIVRLRSGAVAEQIDADHRPARIAQQLGEPVRLPRRLERATPSMHENHRRRHDTNRIGRRSSQIGLAQKP